VKNGFVDNDPFLISAMGRNQIPFLFVIFQFAAARALWLGAIGGFSLNESLSDDLIRFTVSGDTEHRRALWDYYKSANGYIHYIKHRPLQDKKAVILSATVNDFFYKKLYPDNYFFHSVDPIELKGRLLQYPEKSFSRHYMKCDKRLLEFATQLAGDTPVITFKKYKNTFNKPAAGHFGNIAGTDKLKGEDIFVIGTPHLNPIQYFLYAAVLGIAYDQEKIKLKYQIVNIT